MRSDAIRSSQDHAASPGGAAALPAPAPTGGKWHGLRLEPDPELGWWPWINLVYLFFVFLPLLFDPRATAFEWGASAVAVLAYLPLHFAGHHAAGWRAWAAVLATSAIGFALVPINAGANTFVIYAIALAAHTLSGRATVLLMLSLLALMWLAFDWFRQPWPYVLITGVVGAMVAIGAGAARRDLRRNAQLRLSQEEVQRLARVAERERIGRDLHDLLGHTLSLVALKSELAVKLLDRDAAAARAEMCEVERITREALAQVRGAVTGMRAAGLAAELASARLALLSCGTQLHYRLHATQVPSQVEPVLALAVREAVTNVMRHAQASQVDVELALQDDVLQLTVADNGIGAGVVPGNGLDGMRERIAAVGGTLSVDSQRGFGTRLEVRIPHQPADAGAGT